MKKLFVLAVLLVVIGVLCAVFFLRDGKQQEPSDEKPWTVGAHTSAVETTEEMTTQGFADAVEAFSAFVHTELREKYAFLSEQEEPVSASTLGDSLLSVYVYDADTDGAEELSVVRANGEGVTLDVYEYGRGKVRFADSLKLDLDPMNDVSLSLTDADLRHVQARLTIYPSGADRFYCLTVEQQTVQGEYNAYTVVLEYAKEKLKVKKSYRLRQTGDVVTLMCTDNVTLLYRQAADQPEESADTGVTLAKYGDLDTAFRTEFAKLGLNAPQVTAENGMLTQYKVTAVESEQHLFDVTVDSGAVSVTENGFLQSFILRQ